MGRAPYAIALLALAALSVQPMPVRAAETAVAQADAGAEERIRDRIAAMDRERGRGDIGVPREDGELLHRLVQENNARNVIEIGTLHGYSGLWLGLGLRQTGGRLTSFEIDPRNAERARENFRRAGIDDIVTIVVGDAHVEVTKLKEPIDLLFIDADKEGYLDYLRKLLPLVRVGGLIVAHNMRVPMPDQRFVEAITLDPDLETRFVNMGGPGIAITRKKQHRAP